MRYVPFIRTREFSVFLGSLLILLFTFVLVVQAAFAIQIPIIYWTDRADAKIHRLDQQANVQNLVAEPVALTPAEIALDIVAGKMYWVDYSTRQINRANLDGSFVETLYEPPPGFSLWGITLDSNGGKMYWTEPSNINEPGYSIRRANLDGSGVEDLITAGLIQPNGIALNSATDKIYWAERSTSMGCIRQANLDGSGIEDLVTGLGAPSGIALDIEAGKLYWAEITGDRIARINLDGSNVETLVERSGVPGEPQNPIDIALDLIEGKMYWTDGDTGKIQRANLDGSILEDVLIHSPNPIGLALDLTHSATVPVLPVIVPEPVPEPSTLLLLSSGLAGLILFRRKKLFKKA